MKEKFFPKDSKAAQILERRVLEVRDVDKEIQEEGVGDYAGYLFSKWIKVKEKENWRKRLVRDVPAAIL